MALQILYFVPGNLIQPDRSFKAIAQQLIVSPVVRTLVVNNAQAGGRGSCMSCMAAIPTLPGQRLAAPSAALKDMYAEVALPVSGAGLGGRDHT